MIQFGVQPNSPISQDFLAIRDNNFDTQKWTHTPLTDISEVTGFTTKSMIAEIKTQQDDLFLYTDAKYLLVARKKNLPNGNTVLHTYIETLPFANPTIADAITSLATIQLYVVKKFNLPMYTIVNLHRSEVGFLAVTDFRIVEALNNEENFIYEVICTMEPHLLFSLEEKRDGDTPFPFKVLNLFTRTKFPGKFVVGSTFDQAIQLIESKYSD